MDTVIATTAGSRNRFYRHSSERVATVVVALLSTGLLTAAPTASSAQDVSRPFDSVEPMSVRFQDGLLSLEAAQRPWSEVLSEIQRKTGTRFHHAFSLKGSVSVSIRAMPVKDGLKRLFSEDASFIFQYPTEASRSEGVPRDVWILGRERDEADRDLKAPERAPHIPRDRAWPLPSQQTMPDQSADVFRDSAAEEANLRQRLLAMTEDDDPGVRVQALTELANGSKAEDADVQFVLDAALTDKDPNVRGAAIQAAVSLGGSEVMVQLRQALQDPDPGVRILAVDNVVPGKEGKALLEEALSDADETVRLMAAERLKQSSN